MEDSFLRLKKDCRTSFFKKKNDKFDLKFPSVYTHTQTHILIHINQKADGKKHWKNTAMD